MRLVSVAVPVPTLDLLTYAVPEDMHAPCVGARVLVPLGVRQVTGLVVRVGVDRHAGRGDLREIIELIDADSFLPPHIVELAEWLAGYYACGPGEALAAAMPPYAWIESERAAAITDAGLAVLREAGRQTGLLDHAADVSGPSPTDAQMAILRMLGRGKTLPLRVVSRRLTRSPGTERPALGTLVAALERAGLVTTATALRGRGAAFKTARIAAISAAGLEAFEQPSTVARRRQRDVLDILRGSPHGVSLAELRDRNVAADTIRRLAAKGLVTVRTVRVERDPFADGASQAKAWNLQDNSDRAVGSGPPFDFAQGKQAGTQRRIEPQNSNDVVGSGLEAETGRADRVLTEEQSHVLERLRALAARGAFAVALLHGVTGSGKTEVYVRLAADVLASGRSVLVLVPEIALTPALVSLLRRAFGDRVAVQHSGLSDGERHDQWQRIRGGEIAVVVGTRSAVFAPLQRLGLIVVDEEHDSSYKQEETPRYHGRDVAIVRAKREGALVVLGSATPSMETYQHALAGRYEHLVLTRRVLDRPLATVRIVNMREEYASEGPDVIFSRALVAAIEDRLSDREQVLVLLNRRGFATAVFCRQCGNLIECPNCSVSLTVHGRRTRRARCHYCNYSAPVPTQCPACAAPYLEHVGIATERLEEEAARLFPSARVARLDRDVASRRGATASVLGRFGAGEIDILIGTQMIAKGHDFPRVTLVGVISADVGLGLPDFRASERTFQLLTQVVGRAGRGERRGEAIIQTLFPGHYSVRLACEQDYRSFFAREIEFRRAMRYPPHVSLVNAIVRGPSLQAAMEDGGDLVRRIRAAADGAFRVLGPAPAALTKLRGEHRVQFFVKGTRRAAMRQAVQAAVAARPDLRRRVTIDVDPLSVL